MKLIEVTEADARAYMREHYDGVSFGRRKVDFQNGGYATDFTFADETILRIHTDPNSGVIWKINKGG